MSLATYTRKKDLLICIDSDGCAMDTMDIKHIRCFGPCMVDEWELGQWREPILKRWNEINLYTMTRGINRFKALVMALQEINETYCPIEGLADLEDWAANASELSNGSVLKAAEEKDSEILRKAYNWSKAVNESIAKLPEELKKPFDGVSEGIKLAHQYADIAIVSSANPDAVSKEWGKYGLLDDVDIMLTQDVGSKAYCIGEMKKKGYDADKILMVGDAPGDRNAAQKNGVLYFPIMVRREAESWTCFREEALDVFVKGEYKGAYEDKKIQEFYDNLK